MIIRTFVMDTSFYGSILTESDRQQLIDRIKATRKIFVVGISVIEDELYETPSHVSYRGEAARRLLFALYEFLVDENIKLPPIAAYLAGQYLSEYKKRANASKSVPERNLRTDFEIMAVASLRSADVVVSSDKRTMLSGHAKKAYDAVNARNGLRTPELVAYEDFKKKYLTEKDRGGSNAF